MNTDTPLHLAVALDGAGWHPAAWREASARPADLLDPAYWVELVTTAEAGRLDFVTLEDSLALQSSRNNTHDSRTDLVRGRLDAVMVAARVAPLTGHIGLIPSVTVTHTEPFHTSKAIATLDYVSLGRAGVRVQVSGRPQEAAHFGRRQWEGGGAEEMAAELFSEAADYVEVIRRLWDSWEDDAEIRDVASGRFVDREKLHYIEFRGRWFNVKGPSITPRPLQGQPVVTALAHSSLPYLFGAEQADIVLVTPTDPAGAAAIIREVRGYQHQAGRPDSEVVIMADLVVFLGATQEEAEDRKASLDAMFGHPYRSDAAIFTGTAPALAELMSEWNAAGVQGFRLRPAGLPLDLEFIVSELVPELQRRSLFRTAYRSGTLRDRMGWPRPSNRYTVGAPAKQETA